LKLTASIEIEPRGDESAAAFSAKVRTAIEGALAELLERGAVSSASPCRLRARTTRAR